MNTVYDRLGKTVRRGEGLRPVLRHARMSPVNVISCKPKADSYAVTFYYADGAICETQWADWRTLCYWIVSRRSWGVTRLTFDRKMESTVIVAGAWDAYVKRVPCARDRRYLARVSGLTFAD